jgi:predicted aspartyl protease
LAVRVKIRLKTDEESVATSALVNSGFESEEPLLILPMSLAESLNLMKSPTIAIEEIEVAGGARIGGYRVEELADVELVMDDREPVKVKANVTALPGEKEVIIGARLASVLGIAIIDAYAGLWCLRDELGKKQRRSAEIKKW